MCCVLDGLGGKSVDEKCVIFNFDRSAEISFRLGGLHLWHQQRKRCIIVPLNRIFWVEKVVFVEGVLYGSKVVVDPDSVGSVQDEAKEKEGGDHCEASKVLDPEGGPCHHVLPHNINLRSNQASSPPPPISRK